MFNNTTEVRVQGARMWRLLIAALAGFCLLWVGAGAGSATAAQLKPAFDVSQQSQPTHLAPGQAGGYRLIVRNVSAVDNPDPVTITDTLPAGVTATGYFDDSFSRWDCPGVAGATVVTCTLSGGLGAGGLAPSLTILVQVDPGVSGVRENVVTLDGPGDTHDTSAAATMFSATPAGFGVTGFTGWALDRFGVAARQAGSHPDVTTTINLASVAPLRTGWAATPAASVKDVKVDLPPGLIGNPRAVPTCAPSVLAGAHLGLSCPPASQVGVAGFSASVPGLAGLLGPFMNALYNVDPPPGVAARFGFSPGAGVVIIIDATLRINGEYGITANISGASQTASVPDTVATFWGVPADHTDPTGVNSTRIPLITAPTSCTGQPLTTKLAATSWQQPDVVSTASTSTNPDGSPTMTEGCDQLEFDPEVTAVPTTSRPDAPSGLVVTIDSPQNLDNPDGLATAHLRDAKVTLPEGMTINPASADGLGACSDDQLGLGNDHSVSCPDSAKIGTVMATTPVLTESLTGRVYLRSQASSDPESGDMFRLALVLENKERGILVKLPGSVRVSKSTGRIVTEFNNNPQLPVDHIELSLKTGPRAPLATPASCGAKTIDTTLISWGGQTVNRTSPFTVDCTPGLGGFAPSLTAGTANPAGGAFSPFAVSIEKPDGNADVDGLTMSLPTGLLAKLKGNLNTQVGTVTALAGPGASPFALPGKVFLEGAYGDAPFSLRVEVPAKAGPFDLGTVTVRQKIYVDPIDAHVTVVSDPVPTIVSGVPVRLQRLDVNVDKAGFIINPTSCAQKEIKGDLHSVANTTAALSVRFQVGSCSDLALKPNLALSLSGKGQTTDGKHPAVTANLVQTAGQANLKKVRVTLPLSLALDPDNANGLCEFADGSKATPTCPKNSIVGTATATTPILDEPLSGPVYFVKNIRKDPKSGREIRTLPKLVIPLVGQNGVKLTLTGTSDVEDDQLVTTFDNIPDAPVSTFKLNIIGGKGGILTVSGTDICKATQVADQQIDGQNTKNADTDVYIQTPSCPLKVLSKKVGKSSVAVKVGGLGAGKVTLTGRGIKKATKTITKSTVAKITAKRTKGTPGKVTVSFDPTGPARPRKTTR
jgi:uncharacterized repeat protein (TIGR01451 family)